MGKGIYQLVVEANILEKDLNMRADNLITLARRCDSLRNDVQYNAAHLAQKLESFAKQVAERYPTGCYTPLDSSAATDLMRDAAVLQATKEAFQAAFIAETGKAFAKALEEYEALRKGVEAVVNKNAKVSP